MAFTMKWVKVSDDEWKGSTGYSEYRIVRRQTRSPSTNAVVYVYHGYKASKYIAQGPSLEEAQAKVTSWIRKNS